MRLKTKPKAPKRKKAIVRKALFSEASLSELLAQAVAWGLEPDKVRIVLDRYWDNADLYVESTCPVLEPEQEFLARVSEYKKRLKKYNVWREENKEAIEAEESRRALEAETKKQKEIKELETALARLRA